VLEGGRRQRQGLGAAGGEPDELAAAVGGLPAALGVAELGEPVDGLARGLLGNAEAPPDVRRRGAEGADGLHREPVRGPQLRVPAGRELLVRLVDHRAERGEQQQRELVPGAALARRNRQPGLPSLSGNPVN